MNDDKRVYTFGGGNAEGAADMKNLLGGKGANLAEMSSIGLPVPPGFTVTTKVCAEYYEAGERFSDELREQVDKALQFLQDVSTCKFGGAGDPLLVSVRSGARVSMPGMMDTVLNLGLNDETVHSLAKKSNDARFAWDSYRRLVQMYGDVVLGVDQDSFEEIIEIRKETNGFALDTDLTAEDWQVVVGDFKARIEAEVGHSFPQNPVDQLWGSIAAVFRSWNNERAHTYRRINGIPSDWGTAVTVQAMVFGNMGQDSATGVAFTRNPSTGANEFYGEYLLNAQGEDVVAGIRTPQQLTILGKKEQRSQALAMEEVLPDVFSELDTIRLILEKHYRDMQDIEFTIQQGKLWMLQTRPGKRTANAALTIACDLVREGVITKKEAVLRIEPASLDQLLHPTLDTNIARDVLTRGLPASPGAASGKVVFSADNAENLAAKGEAVILVRVETSPEDIHGMHAARGILTSRGGMTSHAAVVARGMGRPCVSGASELVIDYATKTFNLMGRKIAAGDIITIDGASGDVIAGEVPMVQPKLSADFETLMGWVDEVRSLNVRVNAETLNEAQTALGFGAEGIGLCRTEHMFFDSERIVAVREMILAKDASARRRALEKILPMQRQDFIQLFNIMRGKPVTIRLLDPPLHEFLPHTADEIKQVANASGLSEDELRARSVELKEVNPMLGHRGCRLGISYPEIVEIQARAIFEAAVEAEKSSEECVQPEVMIPLICDKAEFDILRQIIDAVAEEVFMETSTTIAYIVGTMIELPRSALQGARIAEGAEFFSFGTNDLTQTTLGISRDDTARMIKEYTQQEIFDVDPFVTIDKEGVGELMTIAVERGRSTRPDLKLGICGEHGGDPESIRFCAKIGLDYVSCSPYRVPIARLAAAQAALEPDH